MQLINTAKLLNQRDAGIFKQPIDTTIHIRDNRKAYFQRKQQAKRVIKH